jgi:hypothetical protein
MATPKPKRSLFDTPAEHPEPSTPEKAKRVIERFFGRDQVSPAPSGPRSDSTRSTKS